LLAAVVPPTKPTLRGLPSPLASTISSRLVSYRLAVYLAWIGD
jgi:hypothetical protein